MGTQTDEITLDMLKIHAIEDKDFALFQFLADTDRELTRLRALGKVVARMHERGGLNDENWQALFDALFDAGLVDT